MKMAIRIESRRRALMASTYVLLGLASLTILAGVVLSAGRVMAETAVVNDVSIAIDPSCSFIAGGGNMSTSITNGQYGTIVDNTITTLCNDTSGYAIYAIGYSGEQYSGDYHTDMISSLGNSYNIKTNGTGTNSYWKMMITNPSNATVSGSFGTYQQIPSTFTQVATYGSSTASGSITPQYEVYIGTNQPAGTYTGKVKYTLVHPNTMVAGTYTIAYNANGGSGTMASSTPYNFDEFTLPASTFTAPSGYRFAGWCTTNTAGSYACDGTSYADGATLPASPSASATANGTLTLYAYWGVIPTFCTLNSAQYCMQDVSTWGSTLANNQEVTAMDSRDGKEYTVAKLADGNIWMTQNLDHDIKTDGSVTYDSTTTDVSSTWTPSTATYSTGTTTWNNSDTAPESYDPGDLCWNGTLGDYNLSTGTTTCTSENMHYHIGNYYNWTAAVAMNDSGSYTSMDTDVNQSICPAGWMLPKSGNTLTGSGSFLYLKNQLSLTSGNDGNIQNSPVYFVYGGNWAGSSSGVGYAGFYLSSVVGLSGSAYDLAFHRYGYLNPQYNDTRAYGDSVRCVARSS